MQSVVYIDMLFLINALLSYFLLRAAAMLCGCESNVLRMILASIFAGFSSFIIFIEHAPTILIWCIKIASCIAICAIAFKASDIRTLLKRIFWYLVLNITLAGTVFAAIYYFNAQGMHYSNLVVYFDVSPPVLILSVVAVYLCIKLSGILFARPHAQQFSRLRFMILGSPCECTALIDTGFSVKDLFMGKKVFMLSFPLICAQIPAELCEDLNAYFKGDIPSGNTVFSIVSVHTASGVRAMPIVKVTNLQILLLNKKISHAEAAAVFTPQSLGSSEFEAIVGHDIVE